MNMITINTDVLTNYALSCANDYIGKDGLTVMEEFQRAMGLTMRVLFMEKKLQVINNPETVSANTKAGYKLLMMVVEMSEEEIFDLEKRTELLLQKTAKKILWLSANCKAKTGEGFVEGFVRTTETSDCLELIFEYRDCPDIKEAI